MVTNFFRWFKMRHSSPFTSSTQLFWACALAKLRRASYTQVKQRWVSKWHLHVTDFCFTRCCFRWHACLWSSGTITLPVSVAGMQFSDKIRRTTGFLEQMIETWHQRMTINLRILWQRLRVYSIPEPDRSFDKTTDRLQSAPSQWVSVFLSIPLLTFPSWYVASISRFPLVVPVQHLH